MPFPALPAVLWLADPWHDVLALVLAAVVYRPAADLTRFALASPAARRHYPGMIRARHRWHWICRCTGLAQPELAPKNRPAAESSALVLVLVAMTWRLLALVIGFQAAERSGRIQLTSHHCWPRMRQPESAGLCSEEPLPKLLPRVMVHKASRGFPQVRWSRLSESNR
jgi:hypothetical protein